MNTDTIEARREAIQAIRETLDEQHRVAVESGDRTLSEAVLAQFEALYEQAMRGEQEAVSEARELAEAHSTLFLLRLKGAGNRMRSRMTRFGSEATA
jgi:hypothetical protein